MVTKVIKEQDSSAGIVAIIAILAVLLVGFFLYNQGYFGHNSTDVNINLPNGKTISGSVKE